jgi:hypothetical protein
VDAGWAVLSVVLPDGTRAHGVADVTGQAVVIFPYPEPVGGPLPRQEWELTVTARFGTATGALPAPDGVPDLCGLFAQQPARLLAGPGEDLPAVHLAFGHELVLRSIGRPTLLLDSTS